MKQLTARVVCIVALGFGSVAPLTAQDAPAALEVGLWSGDLTPMHHPDLPTPLRFAVSEAEGSPAIEIRGPGDIVLPTHDLSVSEAGVVFSFFEPEADILLRCDLRFDDHGVLVGRCTDPNGKWAGLTMRPPSSSAG